MNDEDDWCYVKLGDVDDFPPGRGRIVSAARKPIAVFRVGGQILAVNNICPHMGGPIGAGKVEGETVACPYHGMCFNLRSGRSVDGFGHSLQTYDIKIEDGQVFIRAPWKKR